MRINIKLLSDHQIKSWYDTHCLIAWFLFGDQVWSGWASSKASLCVSRVLRKIQIVLSDWETDRWSSGSFGQELIELQKSHSSSFGMHQFAEELATGLYAALSGCECVNGNAVKKRRLETHILRKCNMCLSPKNEDLEIVSWCCALKNTLAYCWDIRLYQMTGLGCRKRSLGQFSLRA